MTTTTATKKRRSPRKRKIFAKALTVSGRFTLSWMLFKAALRILVKGRALI